MTKPNTMYIESNCKTAYSRGWLDSKGQPLRTLSNVFKAVVHELLYNHRTRILLFKRVVNYKCCKLV